MDHQGEGLCGSSSRREERLDARLLERPEHPRGGAQVPGNSHAEAARSEHGGDGSDSVAFGSAADDAGSFCPGMKGVADVYRDPVLADRSQRQGMKDPGAEVSQGGGLAVGQALEAPGPGDQVRRRAEHSVDIGPDLDLGCRQHRGEECSGEVRRPAAESGGTTFAVGGHEAGDQANPRGFSGQ